MSSLIRNIVIVLVLVVLAAVGYQYFLKDGSESGTTALGSSGSVNSEAVRIGNEFRTTLNSIRTISLSNALFADPVFSSLRDFTQPLTSVVPGRQNPFAPLGAEGSRSRGGPSVIIE